MRINNAQNQNGIPLVSETPFYRLQKTIAKQVENGKVILTQDDFPTYMDDWYITKIQWGNDLILPNIKYTENTIEIDICPEDEVVAGKVIIEVRQPNVNSIPAEVVFSDELNVAMKISHDAPVSEIQQAGTQLHENNPEKYTSSHYRSLHDFPSDDFIFTNEAIGKDCWYTSLETTLNAQGEIKSLPEVKTWTTDLPSLRLGNEMFMDGNIETFVCALNKLENGTSMFQNTTRLQTFVSRLPRLVNGTNMFYNSSVQTIDFNMPQLVNGEQMFYNSGMVLFAANAPKLENGTRMFDENANLVEFKSNMENLKNGYYMFNNCSQMKQYTSSTPNLTNVEGCFNGCTELENIKGDFGKITSTVNFLTGCSNLIEFDASLASLVDGNNTFQSCQRLKTIKTDLSKLTTANGIFSACTELLDYTGNLSSFTNADGSGLFKNCIKLQNFNGNLSNLLRIDNMFNTKHLETFYGSMEKVAVLDGFFSGNTNLRQVSSNFKSATSVVNMLQGCTSLQYFNGNLSSATSVNTLFDDCNGLIDYSGDLSAATDLSQMFMNKTHMRSFNGCIKNAKNLSKMFYNCSVSSVNFVEPITTTSYDEFDVENMFYGNGVVNPVLDRNSLDNIMANFPKLSAQNLKRLFLVRNIDIEDDYIIIFKNKMVQKGYEVIFA